MTAQGLSDTARLRRSILVAEDNPVHQSILRRVMRDIEKDASVSLTLQFVRDGAAVLAALAGGPDEPEPTRPPDMIMLDLHMPGMSGLECLRALSEDDHLRTIPVVIFSSSDQPHHIDDAYRNGANAYMVKLGDYETLLEQMRRFTRFWLETAMLPRPTAG